MKNIGKRLVFIFGVPRSGTTWVLKLLSEHSGSVFAGPIELDTSRKNLNTFESGIFTIPEYNDQIKVGKIKAFAEKHPDKFLIEKTPSNVFVVDRIRLLFPDCKLIVVERNPRDAIASMLVAGRRKDSFWKDAPKSVETAFAYWYSHDVACKEAIKKFDAKVVKYEELRTNPKKEIKKLFDYVGLDNGEIDDVIKACEGGNSKHVNIKIAKSVGTKIEGIGGGKKVYPGETVLLKDVTTPDKKIFPAFVSVGGITQEGVFHKGKINGWKEVLTDEEKVFLDTKF